jgi:hypothetical protein
MFPVIQARTAAGFFVHIEGDGMNHMKSTMSRHCGAPNIARVLGNLGLPKHDVEKGIVHR